VHDLLTHSRADGTPLPESESPLLDSVRTGAKHRAVDCVLWRSDGGPVYVDLTTAPVYEGENIIGAVMTFVDNSAARASARQAAELTNVLDKDLRGALVDVALRLREVVDYTEAEYAAGGYGRHAADARGGRRGSRAPDRCWPRTWWTSSSRCSAAWSTSRRRWS
jgi:hypothetical protein